MGQGRITAWRLAGYVAWYLSITALSVALLRAADVTEEFHQSYPLAANGRVSLSNVNGAVHITGWDRNEVKIDAVKSGPDAQAVREVEIVVEHAPDSIDIRTKYPESAWGDRGGVKVDYQVSVPRQARLDSVKTVNGSVDVQGIAGDVSAASVNGKVSARQLQGAVSLSTVNGLVDAEVDRVSNKPIALKSVNGAVELSVPANAGAHVSARSLHGRIANDFGLQVQRSGFGPGESLDTTLGSGGPDVRLRTVNGAIQLRKR